MAGFSNSRDPFTSCPSKSNCVFPCALLYGSSLSTFPLHERQLPRGFLPDGGGKSADGPMKFVFGSLVFPLGTSTSGLDVSARILPFFFNSGALASNSKLGFSVSISRSDPLVDPWTPGPFKPN